MSKIKDLKQKEEYNASIVNVLSAFIPAENTSKYIEMLCKLYYKDIKVNDADIDKKFSKVFGMPLRGLSEMTKFEKILLGLITEIKQFNGDYLKDFTRFIEYNERKMIEKNDIQSYNSLLEVNSEVVSVDKKEKEKLLEKQIQKLMEDDVWLVLRPLTYESSLKYGATTKWCTASEKYPNHYKDYTENGALIYFINKRDNTKFAAHCKVKDTTKKAISFWNAEDKPIDSIYCKFSEKVNDIIAREFDLYETNGGVKTNSEVNKEVVSQLDVDAYNRAEKGFPAKRTSSSNNLDFLNDNVANAAGGITTGEYDEIYRAVMKYFIER